MAVQQELKGFVWWAEKAVLFGVSHFNSHDHLKELGCFEVKFERNVPSINGKANDSKVDQNFLGPLGPSISITMTTSLIVIREKNNNKNKRLVLPCTIVGKVKVRDAILSQISTALTSSLL